MKPPKTIADLLRGLPVRATWGDLDRSVTGVAADSRRVQPGDLFVAVPGGAHDGFEFVPEAMRRGAVAVIGERPGADFAGAGAVVQDAHRALADVAAAWFDHPARTLRLFGVTGKKSSHKPQKLVLQMWGENEAGQKDQEAVFSDVQIDLNKPYYVAVAVRVGETGKVGLTFYAKDLSNDEIPLQVFPSPHKIVKMPPRRGAFHLGSGAAKSERSWDGLIDDVRLSTAALRDDQLLLTAETIGNQTAAFWQFEPSPGAFRDSSSNGHDLTRNVTTPPIDPVAAAWADFCQVLLNANEFLYVD